MNFYAKILCAIALGWAFSSHSAIYTWTDESGIVHFSDTPHPGAKTVDMPQTQTYAPGEQPVNTNEKTSEETSDTDRAYESLTISEPKNEATIRNNDGYVPVIVEISPDLKPNDLLQILFDGAALGKPQGAKLFALNNVKRGKHTVAVQALDSEGTVLNTSPAITFFMHRPTINMVPGNKSLNTGN